MDGASGHRCEEKYAMELKLQVYSVRDLAWGKTMVLRDGTLSVDREQLVGHLLQDARLTGVDLEIARPGESCRIGPVFDVAEPRCKLDGSGPDFPGALGPLESVGSGATGVLRGMAVTVVNPVQGPLQPILEMRPPALTDGTAAISTRYDQLVHLVVVPHLAGGLDANDARNALRIATLRASVYLSRAACTGDPEAVETYTLAPPIGPLPRVAYVYQIHSHQHPTVAGEPLLYGDNARHLLPTILHPNEILDGAVLPGYGSMGIETYGVQNHAVILDLYRRHGRELDFAGVVVTVAHQTIAERERARTIASNLVAHTLRADGVVLSKSGGGAPHVDMAEVAHRCEQLGVKTALIAWEISSEGDATEGSALFNYSDLDAIANVGSNGFAFSLPAVDRVITIADRPAVAERLRQPLDVHANYLCGMMDQLGGGRLLAARY
jgi:glycine reductase